MKKCLIWLLVLTLCAGLLTGCSAKNAGSTMSDTMMNGEKGEEFPKQENNSLSSSATGELPEALSSQKLIRKIYLNAETEDLDGLLQALMEKISQLGGYVEQQEIYYGSSNATRRRGTLTVRIPADKLDDFINKVTEQSNIVSSNETTEDVTLTYVATQSRITALETEQTRLLELLSKAETTRDLLEIEERLTKVRTELEQVTSQLRLMDNLVSYGTVNLTVSEVKEYTVVEEPETVWQRIGTGFMNSLKGLGTFFTNLFVFIIVASPYLVLIAAIVVVVLLIIRAAKKKKHKEN